jgi:uncharacterized SAM-binding protein YcdF (DUF218 family)
VFRFLLGFLTGFLTALIVLLSAGTFLRSADEPTHADVIVALSGDSHGARAATAVSLYRAGLAGLILFSGASEDPASVSSAELMARQAVALGVPRAAILLEEEARTTEDNARLVREAMRQRRLASALLVTSGYHQRRAALAFARAFEGTNLRFTNVPADDPDWDAVLWWLDPGQRELTLRELGKLALAYLNR